MHMCRSTYIKITAFINVIQGKLSDMKISVRFTLFYCVILIASILLCNILYQKI